MIMNFGQYEADINVKKTKFFYDNAAELISKGCDCQGCRNYEKAVESFSAEVKEFFDSLGVDAKRSCEVITNCKNPDGTVSCYILYHLCGKLLRGNSAWTRDDNESKWDGNQTFKVTEDFGASFEERCVLVEDGFPHPVLQLEIHARIPWVLEEENDY